MRLSHFKRRQIIGLLAATPMSLRARNPVPQYRVGDYWLYQWELNSQRRMRRAEVVAADEQGVSLRWAPKGARGIVERRSRQLNAFDLDGIEIEALRHPLEVGMRWESRFKWRDPEAGTGSSMVDREITAIEAVQVPAGVFECLCVSARGWWYGDWVGSPTTPPTGPMRERYWYSPSVRAIVKFHAESFQPGVGRQVKTYELQYELLAYGVQ
jgi:hypothetical protein